MKKFKNFAAIAAASAMALAACSSDADNTAEGGEGEASVDYKACIVSDAGGWDDRSFNESAKNGLDAAVAEYGVEAGTAESSSDADFQPNVDNLVSDGCNLVIGVGFSLEGAIETAATANPDLQFGLIDSTFSDDNSNPITLENGRPLVFNTAEASYLAGYVAAGATKTGTVATFGGMQIPSVSIFMDGFADGVAAYNEAHGTSVKLLGWDKATQTGAFTNTFDDQALGKQQAEQFIAQGADIIMPVAGPVGLGAASAALDDGNTLIIGVDSDWYEANPDYSSIILTSVKKEISAAVQDTIKQGVDGTFSSEQYVGTLENGGVSIAPYHDQADRVSDELQGEVDALTEQIKSGELKIETPNAP